MIMLDKIFIDDILNRDLFVKFLPKSILIQLH